MSVYTVVRFVPNPVASECVNVGIVSADESGAFFEFIPNLSRVRAFAKDVNGHGDAIRNLERFLDEFPDQAETLTPEGLSKLAEVWTNFVQFSPLRPSKRPAEELLGQMVPVFLTIREAAQNERRARRIASNVAQSALTNAVIAHRPGEDLKVLKNYEIQGDIAPHKYDVSLVNHVPRLGVSGISLELKTQNQIEADINKVGYRMLDTRKAGLDMPLAVVVIGEDYGAGFVDGLHTMCSKLEAEFVREADVPVWANNFVLNMPVLT